jgi:hypothetical protein
MTAEHDGLDALMAAITDEPLPESAADDPAFLAEHRSARADVALLREQLRIIGETLTEAAPAAKPVPPRRPAAARRRARAFAFGTLAVAAVAGVVTGLGWLMGHSGADSMTSADSGASKAEAGVRFGSPAYLACAATVAEGEVTAVKQLPATGELQVTVQVTRYYKPTRGVENLTYVISEYDLPEPLAKGSRVLFGVTEGSPRPDHWAVGPQEIATERAWITTSLPNARGLTC